jgi:hypothetical protein
VVERKKSKDEAACCGVCRELEELISEAAARKRQERQLLPSPDKESAHKCLQLS